MPGSRKARLPASQLSSISLYATSPNVSGSAPARSDAGKFAPTARLAWPQASVVQFCPRSLDPVQVKTCYNTPQHKIVGRRPTCNRMRHSFRETGRQQSLQPGNFMHGSGLRSQSRAFTHADRGAANVVRGVVNIHPDWRDLPCSEATSHATLPIDGATAFFRLVKP
jgi:hypothetical protein